jgi:hypothetical protein
LHANLPLNKTSSFGAGFRYSPYGPAYNPGAEYWARFGQWVAGHFVGAIPEVIWVVSVLEGQGTRLTFPGSTGEPYISFSNEDENLSAMNLFDQLGFRVWLQVEPGEARIESLFDLILLRYSSHHCVVGVGVDVEWHHSFGEPEGTPVHDEEASEWLAAAQRYNTRYRLFLKHWETSRLPPNHRDGTRFVDDSQMFGSLDEMVAEFADWGRHYYPAPVAFQIGYPADKKWWGSYPDPVKTIGEAILNAVPNVMGLYLVDFSAMEVFPP